MKKSKKAAAHGFVLDCSIAVAWCFPDEKAPYPQAVLDSLAAIQAVVPSLWPFEVANCLLVGERRKRSMQADTVGWLAFLRRLPILVEDESSFDIWGGALNLARIHNLSVYDAAYLDLAMRRDLPLATLDDRLKAAAITAGVVEYRPS